MQREHGFTLIEVMITVAIVGILATIAEPSYSDYVRRGKIVEAASNLSDMRTRLEQYYFDHQSYPTSCIPPAAGAAPANSIYLPAAMKYFSVACAFPTTTSYTLTATGSPYEGMSGFAYTLDQANTRRTASLPSGWSAGSSNSNCWVTKRSGSC
jgi:type IV pilus assembly protein PilE